MSVDVTRAVEVCLRYSKLGNLWRALPDALWNGVAGEEADFDEVRRPLHGVNSATILVEVVTVRVAPARFYGTSCSGEGYCAVVRLERSRLGVIVHDAIVACMRCETIGIIHIDAFDYIDLSISRPNTASEGPERRPDATNAAGHVYDIGNNLSMSVAFLTLNTNAGTTAGIVNLIEPISSEHRRFR